MSRTYAEKVVEKLAKMVEAHRKDGHTVVPLRNLEYILTHTKRDRLVDKED